MSILSRVFCLKLLGLIIERNFRIKVKLQIPLRRHCKDSCNRRCSSIFMNTDPRAGLGGG